jgi:hypothetical protein
MRRRKLSGWNISLGVRLVGYFTELAVYPFGQWSRCLLFVAGKNSMSSAWHLMLGPIHVHGYYLGPKLVEIDFDVSHDPFWGTAISPPPGYRVILGRIG